MYKLFSKSKAIVNFEFLKMENFNIALSLSVQKIQNVTNSVNLPFVFTVSIFEIPSVFPYYDI